MSGGALPSPATDVFGHDETHAAAAGSPLKKASNSTFILSFNVVHMPCGAFVPPSLAFLIMFADNTAESAIGTI